MIKTLRKMSILFFAFLVMGQGFSNQIGQFIGKAKAFPVGANLSVNIGDHTWDVIGLDSNNVNVGPNQFIVQGRVSTDSDALDVTTTASFTASSPYIHLVSGATQNLGNISAGNYKDVFYIIGVDRNESARGEQATIEISAVASNAAEKSGTRTLHVEDLISQNQNYIISSSVNPPNPVVGDTFTVTMLSHTSKPSPENIYTYPVYNPNLVQLLNVTSTYEKPSPSTEDDIWAKNKGGNVEQVLTFKALAVGTVGLFNLIVNQEGNDRSSIHYNDDYGQFQTITISPQLSLEKEVNKTTAGPGETLTYTLNYENTGNGPATGVIISDTLNGDNQSYLSYVIGSGGVYDGGTNTVSFNIGTVEAGASGSVSFQVKIADEMPIGTTVIKNTGKLTSTESGEISSNEVQTIVNSAPEINITKVNDPSGEVNPGGDITYTITVTNTGTMNADEMTLLDHWTFDSDKVATFVDGSQTAGATVDNLNQTISWDLSDINVGEPEVFTFKLHTNSTNPDSGTFTIRNSACLGEFSDERSFIITINDGENGLCSNEVINTVTYNAHLGITKEADPLAVKPGQSVIYTVQVTNPGTADAQNVKITDTLPAGFSYVSGSAKLNNIAVEPVVTDNQLEWQIPSLAAGETLTLTYEVKISSTVTTGTYHNLAVASAENVEENPQAEADTKVIKVIIPQVLGASTGPEVLPQTGHNYSTFNAGFSLFLLFLLLVVLSLRPKNLIFFHKDR